MYIYKITIEPINQVYIGLDTKPSYKMNRWKEHCRESASRRRTKLHNAIYTYGIENCKFEIIMDNVLTIGQLAKLEIQYINQFDSYRNGLNSTPGGDGLGRADFAKLSPDEIKEIKLLLGTRMSEYNKNIKWAGTTTEDRKILTKHLHTEEVYKKKSSTLKKYYEANPDQKQDRLDKLAKWRQNNQDLSRSTCRKNGLKGSAVTSKKLKVEHPNGQTIIYNSHSEFHRKTGQWASYIIQKTEQGFYHNGYKAWKC